MAENKTEVVALVRQPGEADGGLVMHCSPAEAQRRLLELAAFVKANMKNGVDYGVIPGTDKPTLYQPGAQKLCELYGIAHDFSDVETVQNWDGGFFHYRKRCVLTLRRNALYIGAGVGSCNSKEARYAYRWAWPNEVPAHLDKKALATKTFGKNNSIKYKLPNEDIFSLVNTIEKMACKRALVHAVIGVTRSAGIFTQDVEDLPKEVYGSVDETRPWEHDEPIDGEVVEGADVKMQSLVADWKQKIGEAESLANLQNVGMEIAKLPEVARAALKEAYGLKRKEFPDGKKKPAPPKQQKVDAGGEEQGERQPGEDG